jgi:SPP1 gp7 family putative phage head morphogenesis protein
MRLAWFREQKTIYQILDEHRRQIDAGVDGSLRDLERQWKRIMRIIRPYARFLAREAAVRGATIETVIRSRRYQDLMAVIQTQITAFSSLAYQEVLSAKSAMVGISDRHFAQLIPTTSLAQPDVRAIRAIIGSFGDGSPLIDVFARFAPRASAAVRDILATALAEGKNSKQVSKKILEAISGKDIAATLFDARRIAQTEIMRAYRESSHARYMENSSALEGWQWLSALDRRTCPICLGRHGSVHPVSERMATHPQCRCRQIPIVEGVEPILNQTGEEWLRKQPAEVQKAVFPSPGRYKVWSEGMKLEDMVYEVDSAKWGKQPRLTPLRVIASEKAA